MSGHRLTRLPLRMLHRLYGGLPRGCERALQEEARFTQLAAKRGIAGYPAAREHWLERHPWHGHHNHRSIFRTLDGEFQKMRDLFDSHFFNPRLRGAVDRGFAAADVQETEKALILKLDLPGLKKQDIKVKINPKRTLTISGKRESASASELENGMKYSERSAGDFKREFQLPETADTASIAARSEDGVLTIEIQKMEPASVGVSEISIA